MLVERARLAWTEAAHNEYCTAIAFADLQRALLEVRAPIDLIGMASDFVVDESLHVELTSRIAMELGGGVPYVLDLDALSPPARNSESSPLMRANELIVRICCVGETFSVPMLAGSMKSSEHPLTRAVLKQIVSDEAPHGVIGWHYLEWASEQLDGKERERLARVVEDTLKNMSHLWRRLRSKVKDGRTSEGFFLHDVHELGWMESSNYARTAINAIKEDVLAPLADFGIVPNKTKIDELCQSYYSTSEP
ncbi:MAG: hypothetical protein IPJ88_02265 [Myxococcales bacterium]|nr:MAG: hypothetical protein IPJ88_02265 [Myxococcales bacterium]